MKKNVIAKAVLAMLAFAALFTACDSPSMSPEWESITCTLVDDKGEKITEQKCNREEGSDTSFDIYFNSTYTNKKGYKFVKYTDLNGTEVTKFSSDIKVKIVFEPISYTVTFKKGLGSLTEASKLPEDITVKYDEEFTMPENKMEYEGKKSSGWYTGYGTDKKTYSNGAKYKNLTDEDDDKVELTADFTDYDCVIKFNDGNSSEYNLDKGVALPAVPAVPAIAGYTADGWYESGDTTKKVVDFTNYKTTKSVTYYAKYTAKSYKVTFVTDHGTAPKAVDVYTDAKGIDIYTGEYKLSATGYDFVGWYNGTSQKNTLLSTSKDWANGDLEDVTLTAKWTPWKIYFQFFNCGTYTESEVPDGYKYNSTNNVPVLEVDYNQTVTMPDSTLIKYLKNGFKLTGWSTERADYRNNYNPTMEYTAGASYTNTVTQKGKTIFLYPYYEGPAIKIALVPDSSKIDGSAEIKPSSSGNTLNFHKLDLTITRGDVGSDANNLDEKIIQKDGQFILNSYSYDFFFSSSLQPGTVEFTLEASSLADTNGYNKYKQTIIKTISAGGDIVLDFDNMKCSKTTHTYCYADGVFNFDFGASVTKVEVAYGASSNSYTDVTSTKKYTIHNVSASETDKLKIKYTVNGVVQNKDYNIQLLKHCITSATIEITSEGCTIK